MQRRVNGFMPGGNTLYVFSVDGAGIGNGTSQLRTDAKVPAPVSVPPPRHTIDYDMRKFVLLAALLLLSQAGRSQTASDTSGAVGADMVVGKPNAIENGRALFGSMNCAGCHAYDLTGGMGPDLTDNSWLYGRKPEQIFRTIANGTPGGMPGWKDKMSPQQIWQVVAYIVAKQQ